MSSENVRDAFRAFTTTCALITTDGTEGPNVMAAEWTFNVSYHPFLILVSIDPANRTHEMIHATREFGVNLVSEEQIAAMAFAGHYSKADTDKLSSDLFDIVPAKKIRAPMLRGSLLAAECRLVQEIPLGDHTGFLGEVVEFSVDPERMPIVLHHGSRRLGERIQRMPSISVAATPAKASAGDAVSLVGELTGPIRGVAEVSVRVEGPDSTHLAESQPRSSEDGVFQAAVVLPPGVRSGLYSVTATVGDLRGHARFEVTPKP